MKNMGWGPGSEPHVPKTCLKGITWFISVACVSQSRDQVPAITVCVCSLRRTHRQVQQTNWLSPLNRCCRPYLSLSLSLSLSRNKTFYFSCSYTAATYNGDMFLRFPSRDMWNRIFLNTYTTALSHTGNELDLLFCESRKDLKTNWWGDYAI
jgi:hypothetical protein